MMQVKSLTCQQRRVLTKGQNNIAGALFVYSPDDDEKKTTNKCVTLDGVTFSSEDNNQDTRIYAMLLFASLTLFHLQS
jgi:hypothetical protein